MDTKATLVYGAFNLTLEGKEAFVDAQLNKWAERIPGVLATPHSGADTLGGGAQPGSATQAQQSPGSEDPAKKPKKAAAKSSGPSCASRIRTLIDETFFVSPRKANEVGEKLKEKATPYEGKHVAAALISVVQSGKLRRVSDGGVWAYVNP